tara:strand:+ start:393 stop:812 length:420 start_codon:yes stop_codon:yes gene_type:complete
MNEEGKKGIAIRTNGKVERVLIHGLKDMQEVVGGNIEAATSGKDWDLWGNEEGRLLALPMNQIARQFIAGMLGCRIDEILSMHGDFLLLGHDDEGASTDCPEDVADMALAMSMFDDVRMVFTTYELNEDGEYEETHEVL